VIRNRGNFNNHIGLPLSLVELRRRPEIAVVELGMNHAGEISTLVRIAEPEVRVWTNVGDAHVGFFASVDAIADAKAEIFEGARRPICWWPTPTTRASRRACRPSPAASPHSASSGTPTSGRRPSRIAASTARTRA